MHAVYMMTIFLMLEYWLPFTPLPLSSLVPPLDKLIKPEPTSSSEAGGKFKPQKSPACAWELTLNYCPLITLPLLCPSTYCLIAQLDLLRSPMWGSNLMFSWCIECHQLKHLNQNLGGGPTWKTTTYLFKRSFHISSQTN